MSSATTLQTILDGQLAIQEDIKELKVEVKKNTLRLDKIGLQLANLEDDAPTIEEFDGLEKRVSVLEKQIIKN